MAARVQIEYRHKQEQSCSYAHAESQTNPPRHLETDEWNASLLVPCAISAGVISEMERVLKKNADGGQAAQALRVPTVSIPQCRATDDPACYPA